MQIYTTAASQMLIFFPLFWTLLHKQYTLPSVRRNIGDIFFKKKILCSSNLIIIPSCISMIQSLGKLSNSSAKSFMAYRDKNNRKSNLHSPLIFSLTWYLGANLQVSCISGHQLVFCPVWPLRSKSFCSTRLLICQVGLKMLSLLIFHVCDCSEVS